jgi:hypothetical protein
MKEGIIVEEKEHPIKVSVIGRKQYFYTSLKGKISLIFLPNYFMDGVDWWEIYALEGDLIEDIERFKSKKGAEKRINELL